MDCSYQSGWICNPQHICIKKWSPRVGIYALCALKYITCPNWSYHMGRPWPCCNELQHDTHI